MSRVHSEFAPSSLKRKLSCPGSHCLEQALGGEPAPASRYAAEGTVAHAVAERFILERTPARVGTTMVQEGHEIEITEEMDQAVQVYADYLDSRRYDGPLHGSAHERAGVVLDVERTVSLNGLWPGGKPPGGVDIFGHVDALIYDPHTRTLEVVDFKYGRGVPVGADDNPQLLAYAAGAVNELEEAGHRVDHVAVTIVQPRAGGQSVRTSKYARLDLFIWVEDILKPGIDLAVSGNGTLVPGEHCQFCPARPHCPALHQRAARMAQDDFRQAAELTDAELAERLALAEILEPYFAALRSLAAGRLERGRDVPGWALVPKRATRKWTDEDEALRVLRDEFRLNPDVLFAPAKLRSPAQIEKTVPKALRPNLAGLVSAVSSGTTLTKVGADHVRSALPPVASATQDFEPV